MDSDRLSAFADVFSAVGGVDAFWSTFCSCGESAAGADRAEGERRGQAERISAWVELDR
ncbi:hypothetical protein AB0J80_38045 [Actinoplanes sp. NPDC049548]|uniref:hypothetical protein n=1 Tax=Actinoplanes sp. NPDC049548 TaxID=3155152 RepID=UPI003446D4E4